jgi:hypothetical protein
VELGAELLAGPAVVLGQGDHVGFVLMQFVYLRPLSGRGCCLAPTPSIRRISKSDRNELDIVPELGERSCNLHEGVRIRNGVSTGLFIQGQWDGGVEHLKRVLKSVRRITEPERVLQEQSESADRTASPKPILNTPSQ